MTEFAPKGYSDSDARDATDGVIDADTVDGKNDGEVDAGSVGGTPAADMATDTELNNHAGDGSAHHSKPTGTTSTGDSGGYTTDGSNHSDDNTTSDTSINNGSVTVAVGPCDGARVYFEDKGNGDLPQVEVRLLDSGGATIETMASYGSLGSNNNYGTWLELTASGVGEKVEVVETNGYSVGVAECQPHVIPLKNHSHSI